LEVDLAESMALLEMEFPPSFFNIMMHLPYHIIEELDMCGLVATRWMYPVERYMKMLKKNVRNMARPEASMAEGYIKDDCIGFVTEYVQRFDVVEHRVYRVVTFDVLRENHVRTTSVRPSACLPCCPPLDSHSPWWSALADDHPTSCRPLRPAVGRRTAAPSGGQGGGRLAGGESGGRLGGSLKLNYGAVCNPVIFLRCEWIKREDNCGNPTYLRDEAGFLVVNSRHKLPSMSEPFIFSSQATHVFFSDDPGKPGWKVVLRNEPRAKWEVADTSDIFITTSVETTGLTAPTHVPAPPTILSLESAIPLSVEEHLLASAKY
jgi:hypothetical protein